MLSFLRMALEVGGLVSLGVILGLIIICLALGINISEAFPIA